MERPILMHSRSIIGILQNRKTQTRRIVKKIADSPIADWEFAMKSNGMYQFFNPEGAEFVKCPYGVAVDRLWVRETFFVDDINFLDGRLPSVRPDELDDEQILYRANGECCDQIAECCCAESGKPKWRPSIFMPRWASRLTLELTDVRVERVQEITLEDCLEEGIPFGTMPTAKLRDAFREPWDATNGKGAWERNDWVWVVGFRRAE